MSVFNSSEQLFVQGKERWESICGKNYRLPDPPTVTEIENGIILPMKKRTDVVAFDGTYEGGVCDSKGNFVTANTRRLNQPDGANYTCTRAYAVPSSLKTRHETVVFGGVLIYHFGHVILESLSRLWWYADHQDTPYKIVFLNLPLYGGFTHSFVLDAAGLTSDRIEIISEPTQFDNIIAPQEAFYFWSGYRPGWEKIYDLMQQRAKEGPYKKVYLSRTELPKNDGLNEEYFETFYRKRGFQIIYPEKLPFLEQISILYGAEEVVCTIGTLAHMLIFCKPHTKVTILNRTNEVWSPWIMPLQLRSLDYAFVDATINVLPAAHAGSNYYLYGPTRQWQKYLDTKKIPYDSDEVSIDIHLKPLMYDYMVNWAKNYSRPVAYKRIHNQDLLDIISNVHQLFLDGTAIDRSKYAEKDEIVKLRKDKAALEEQNATLKTKASIVEDTFKDILREMIDASAALSKSHTGETVVSAGPASEPKRSQFDSDEIARLEAEVERWKAQVQSMEASRSWKITKPLRAIKRLFKK